MNPTEPAKILRKINGQTVKNRHLPPPIVPVGDNLETEDRCDSRLHGRVIPGGADAALRRQPRAERGQRTMRRDAMRWLRGPPPPSAAGC